MRKYTLTTPYGNRFYVHDNGDIEHAETSGIPESYRGPSGKWKMTGIATYRGRFVRSFDSLDDWVAAGPEFLHKNGNPRYTVLDLDHGHNRMWGNTAVHGLKSIEPYVES